MKERVVWSLMALFISAPILQAQDDNPVRFGLKLAPNLSWIKPDTKGLEKSGNKLGYSFGLMGDFNVGGVSNYAFATGVFLTNIGGAITYPFSYAPDTTSVRTQDVTTDFKLRYIEIPLTMKLKTNEIGYITYYGQIGLGLGFNIRAKADVETVSPSGEVLTEEDVDVLDELKFFRTSLIIGGGMEYNFSGNTSLLVGVTYNGGFSNIADKVELSEEKEKLLANFMELTVGVFF